ncbi:MAG: hypothetical protein SH809_14915 [Rhodothermales bacterium]|nr:hypothetical protein [Rhodothermales bacterium]
MTKLYATLELQGDMFPPSEAERLTGLSMIHKVEPGEIVKRGRYKGQPSPYGAASLAVPEAVAEKEKLEWLLDAALKYVGTFRRIGTDRLYIHASYAFDGQCNLAYSTSELRKLAELDLDFTVSCYLDESQFDAATPAAAG